MISRGRIGMMEIGAIVLISLLLSFPVLVVGSATIGWWVTKSLAGSVRTNRLLVFAMAGMSMGLIADLVLFVLGVWIFRVSLRDIPRGMDGWIHGTLAASIPVFCLTLAGLVAGAHITHSEAANPLDCGTSPKS